MIYSFLIISIKESIENLISNKLKSILTILGISFGIGGLIAISFIGLAWQQSISSEMHKYGTLVLWVRVNTDAYLSTESPILMDEKDRTFLLTALSGVNGSESFFDLKTTVKYKKNTAKVRVFGVGKDHFNIFNINTTRGRTFDQNEIEQNKLVCVLRPTIQSQLFNNDEDPLGKTITIDNKNFVVIGVTDKRTEGFLSDGSDNNTIFVPEKIIAKREFSGNIIKYWVFFISFNTIDDINESYERINNYFNKKYTLLRDSPRFLVQRFDSYIKMFDNILSILSTIMFLISSISIIVSGLGIMNIMLITVTDRSKEIGLRMAFGASPKAILFQFIIEALTFCLIGGLTGIISGILLAYFTCFFLKWKFIFSLPLISLGIGLTTLIGLFFGIHPAYRASKLTPTEALKK